MTQRFADPAGFYICDAKGFRITFENGWTLSVQFGPYNYCEHHKPPRKEPRKEDEWHSNDAETAIIDPRGEFINWRGKGEVQGYKKPADIPAMIAFVSSQESIND